MNAQLLVRSLVSAGSAKAPEGEEGTYMLEVADGYLVEKLWVGGHTTSETPISSDVRDNTSGVYLFPRGGDIVSNLAANIFCPFLPVQLT
jgi:hypothetical protein